MLRKDSIMLYKQLYGRRYLILGSVTKPNRILSFFKMTYVLTQHKQLSMSSISARSSGILIDFNGSRISFIINYHGAMTNKTHFTLRTDVGGTSYCFKSTYKEFRFVVASLGNTFVSHCLQHMRNWVIIFHEKYYCIKNLK